MARKPRPFKPKSKWIRKDVAQRTRDFNRWHAVESCDQPKWKVDRPFETRVYAPRWQEIENEKAAKRQRDMILYCAALGQKQGLLDADCSSWTAEVVGDFVEFYRPDNTEFPAGKRNVVRVTPRFLDWVPDEPVEEILSDIPQPPY